MPELRLEAMDLKQLIRTKLYQAVTEIAKGQLDDFELSIEQVHIQNNKQSELGDYASNIALKLSKVFKQSPMLIAENICEHLDFQKDTVTTTVSKPGFINFHIQQTAHAKAVQSILANPEQYGCTQLAKPKKILLEYVSANPTGPLHVGHGRGAAYGNSLARILKKAGHQVTTEYYINDAGRQTDILTLSAWLRGYSSNSESAIKNSTASQIEDHYPPNAYQGDYIEQLVENLPKPTKKQVFAIELSLVLNLPDVLTDPEKTIDWQIAQLRRQLGDATYNLFKQHVVAQISEQIRQDLSDFRVTFDNWFSEQSLYDNEQIDKTIDKLKQLNLTYQKDKALWFKSTEFGDDKDRVMIREDGFATYFANDISYHLNKFERGYDILVNIWGADHHGYIARMKAAIQAFGYKADQLEVCLVQFATLFRGEQKLQMSTRSGQFISLEQLVKEVGVDATRFFYCMMRTDQHMNFDLQLAVEKSNENPVFYVQYAKARVSSVFKRADQRGLPWQSQQADLQTLNSPLEQRLIRQLMDYPEMIEKSAEQMAPHMLVNYLKETASLLHQYYNQTTMLTEDGAVRNARLSLLQATAIVLADGLDLLGVSAPDSM